MTDKGILHSQGLPVSCVGDVEGDWPFLERSLESIGDIGPDRFFPNNRYIVFMGDITDKAVGDMRCLAFINNTLEDPRAFGLLGNRDLTFLKLYRLTKKAILEDAHIALKCPPRNRRVCIGFDRLRWEWVGQSRPLFIEYACEQLKKTECQLMHALEELSEDEIEVLKLKWFLPHTMGAGLAFENRRLECQKMGKPDDDISVKSTFKAAIGLNGEKLRYLSQAKMALIIDQAIFVHASINKHSVYVPDGLPQPGTLQEYVQRINALKDRLVVAIKGNLVEDKNPSEDPETAALIEIFMVMAGPYIRHHGYAVNSDFPRDIDDSSMIRRCPRDKKLLRVFQQAGVHTLVVGHQPTGVDFPIVLRHALDENFTFTVLSTDTYSKRKNEAAVLTTLHFSDEGCRIHLSGIQQNGDCFDRTYVINRQGQFVGHPDGFACVGTMLPHNPAWSVQWYDADKETYLLHACMTRLPFTAASCLVARNALDSFDRSIEES